MPNVLNVPHEYRLIFSFMILLNLLVGGIYTVIRSKAYVSTEEMGDQYCLLGPYKEHCARTEVEEQEFPAGSPLQIAVSRMRDQGYQVVINVTHPIQHSS